MFRKKKVIFDKINDYLIKKGHEMCMSIYLNNYNGNNIYIRFDYVKKMSVYKVVWIDLNFFNEGRMEDYINSQMMTKFLAMKLVNKLTKEEHESCYDFNNDIIGDRVEVLTYFNEPREYVFDRFLPLGWDFLIDPLAMIFSYLPRGMEVFLNEIFGKYDHLEERYNYLKPVKFDLLHDDFKKLFKEQIIEKGEKYFTGGKVSFLEKIENKYTAIVDGTVPYLVVLECVSDSHVLMWCNCKYPTFCKHIYAVIRAIREKKFNNFYKVRYVGSAQTLLDKVTVGNFYLCFGVEGDKLLLVTSEGNIFPANIMHKNKCVFEVIEDDDECSLSKYLEEVKEK